MQKKNNKLSLKKNNHRDRLSRHVKPPSPNAISVYKKYNNDRTNEERKIDMDLPKNHRPYYSEHDIGKNRKPVRLVSIESEVYIPSLFFYNYRIFLFFL